MLGSIIFIIGLFLSIGVFSLFIMLMIIETKNKDGELGVNFEFPSCPNCNYKAHSFPKATTLNQALWGDRTCQICGCEMDKWGNNVQEVNNSLVIYDKNDKFKDYLNKSAKTPLEKIIEEDKKQK